MFEGLSSSEHLLALVVLLAGVLLARLGSVATGAVLGALDRRAARLSTTADSILSPRFVRVTRTVVFWLMLVLAVAIALRLVQVGRVGETLQVAIGFIPQLLVGFIIIVSSHVLGLIASHLLAQRTAGGHAGSSMPRLVHAAAVTVGVVMTLQYLGINVSFLTQLLLVLLGLVGAGLMLAFALGARRHVSNLVAGRELARYALGDRIRIGELEGEIVAIHDTGLELATAAGIAAVPAHLLADGVVIKRPRDESSD